MLRHFLLCAGVHGDRGALERLRQFALHRRPDGIIFAGGVLAPNRQYDSRLTSWDMTREDAHFVEAFYEALGGLCIFTAVIPGPWDSPLDEFLRLGMHAEIEFPGLHLIHGTLVEKSNSAWFGLGGNFTDGPAAELEVCSRTLAEYQLRVLWASRKPRKALVLDAAPRGPLGGREGRAMIWDWIDSYHPDLCVVAGASALRGVQQVARTLVVNPGYLTDGSAAWLDWQRCAAEAVEFLDLGEVRGGTAFAEVGG